MLTWNYCVCIYLKNLKFSQQYVTRLAVCKLTLHPLLFTSLIFYKSAAWRSYFMTLTRLFLKGLYKTLKFMNVSKIHENVVSWLRLATVYVCICDFINDTEITPFVMKTSLYRMVQNFDSENFWPIRVGKILTSRKLTNACVHLSSGLLRARRLIYGYVAKNLNTGMHLHFHVHCNWYKHKSATPFLGSGRSMAKDTWYHIIACALIGFRMCRYDGWPRHRL